MVIKIDASILIDAINSSITMGEAAAKTGLYYRTFKSHAKKLGIYKPNPGGKGTNKPKKEGFGKTFLKEILSGLHPQYQTYKLKHRLYYEKIKENKCDVCGITEWLGKVIECELDHIDGNSHNHKLENLRIICPNCHSQTETFRSKVRIALVA